MAKKSRKKSSNNLARMIISLIIIAFAVLTICTLFMSVINVTGKVGIFGFGSESTTVIKGTDIFASAFNGEVSSDLTVGADLLVGLKTSEGAGFVTNVFIWGYILTIIVAIASLVIGILSLLGVKFNKTSLILGAVVVLLALVTFIFAIVVAGKFSGDTGIEGVLSAGSTGALAFGGYLLIATLIGGGVQVYSTKK